MPLVLAEQTPEELLRRIGERLRDARIRQQLTIIQVAVRAGVAQKVVERAEAGLNTHVIGLLSVARVVGVYMEVG